MCICNIFFVSFCFLVLTLLNTLIRCYCLRGINRQHPSVLGLNNVNLAHLATVMIEALVSGIVAEPVATRLAQTLKACLSRLDVNISTAVWNSVSAEKRKVLQDMNFL